MCAYECDWEFGLYEQLQVLIKFILFCFVLFCFVCGFCFCFCFCFGVFFLFCFFVDKSHIYPLCVLLQKPDFSDSPNFEVIVAEVW